MIATGRSDYPNQVNNVLCFPFIFRGALDVGASTITREMELAAVKAIAELAQAEQSDIVARAYGDQHIAFGPDYLIPRPFDPRLIGKIAPAVARAAMDERRRDAPDRGLRRLPRAPEPVRLPVRPHHEAGVRGGEGLSQARGLHRGRGRARAARGPGGGGRGHGAPDARRPPRSRARRASNGSA